jgi:hypothetical protein
MATPQMLTPSQDHTPAISAHQTVHQLISHLQAGTLASISGYGQAHTDPWFATKIRDLGLLSLLQYAGDEVLVQSMHAILYAFTHPGTREGFCQLCLGVFGKNSLIFLEDGPATLAVRISLQQNSYNFTLASLFGYALAGQEYAVAGTSLARITQDPKLFLQQFLPAGVVLKSLDIEIEQRKIDFNQGGS